MSVHDGHRDRVRKEYIAAGVSEHTPPHKMLEMLLFYARARGDTNQLAHTLINTFGSYAGVIDAPTEELMKIDGIGEHTAFLFKLLLPAAKLYSNQHKCDTNCIQTVDQAAEYMANLFLGCRVETVYLLCLDNKGKVLTCPKLSTGDVISVAVSPRTVVEQALLSRATVVVLAHNHPQGFALPSSADVALTIKIMNALKTINVRLMDHIVVTDGDYTSMALSKKYADLFLEEDERRVLFGG